LSAIFAPPAVFARPFRTAGRRTVEASISAAIPYFYAACILPSSRHPRRSPHAPLLMEVSGVRPGAAPVLPII
jgi:hypothetical protein